MTPEVVLVGTGNLASHLARRMIECGVALVQVFGRDPEKTKRFCAPLQIPWTSHWEAIRQDADLYMLCVSDQAIPVVASLLGKQLKEGAFAVHTSGATSIEVLAPFFERRGVFYPLQTFSAGRSVAFEHIPVCIDAAAPGDLELLRQLGGQISHRVAEAGDEARLTLHLAAVISNNFVNHLYAKAFQLLEEKNLSPSLLYPLIEETARKVQEISPLASQTGPAIRGDQRTIDRHLEYLSGFPDIREIYQLLTRSIQSESL
ncbi:MAG: DUF2520 domain-containing protein [Haliscomenobacter sp.]|nr:DUF2520 domain-containing protein [Haliscomenobacter sp.]